MIGNTGILPALVLLMYRAYHGVRVQLVAIQKRLVTPVHLGKLVEVSRVTGSKTDWIVNRLVHGNAILAAFCTRMGPF